jgi:hypothetical protein
MRPKNQYVFITAEAKRRRESLYSLRLSPTHRGDFFAFKIIGELILKVFLMILVPIK